MVLHGEQLKRAFANTYIFSGDQMVVFETGSPGDDRSGLPPTAIPTRELGSGSFGQPVS